MNKQINLRTLIPHVGYDIYVELHCSSHSIQKRDFNNFWENST